MIPMPSLHSRPECVLWEIGSDYLTSKVGCVGKGWVKLPWTEVKLLAYYSASSPSASPLALTFVPFLGVTTQKLSSANSIYLFFLDQFCFCYIFFEMRWPKLMPFSGHYFSFLIHLFTLHSSPLTGNFQSTLMVFLRVEHFSHLSAG